MSYVKACFFSLIVHMNFLISRRGSAWWIAAFVSIEPLERVAEPFAAHSFWTLHCCGDLVGRKSWSKISLTTCLTTYTKFGVKNFIIEAWLNLVERCVRDAEVACSNHVVSTTNRIIKPFVGCVMRFVFLCSNISLPRLQSYRFGSFEGCPVLGRVFFVPLYSLFYAAQFLNASK